MSKRATSCRHTGDNSATIFLCTAGRQLDSDANMAFPYLASCTASQPVPHTSDFYPALQAKSIPITPYMGFGTALGAACAKIIIVLTHRRSRGATAVTPLARTFNTRWRTTCKVFFILSHFYERDFVTLVHCCHMGLSAASAGPWRSISRQIDPTRERPFRADPIARLFPEFPVGRRDQRPCRMQCIVFCTRLIARDPGCILYL